MRLRLQKGYLPMLGRRLPGGKPRTLRCCGLAIRMHAKQVRITLFQATRYEPWWKLGSDQKVDLRFREALESLPKSRIKELIRPNCARISPLAAQPDTSRHRADSISH